MHKPAPTLLPSLVGGSVGVQGVATVASDNGKVSVAIFCTSWAFLAGGYSSPWLLERTNHLGASSSNLVGILFPLCHAHFLCSLQQDESWQM